MRASPRAWHASARHNFTTGLPAGVTFTDHGDGTGELAGTVTTPPGDVTVNVGCDVPGSGAVSRALTLSIVRAELSIRWAQPLVDLRPGPATVRALVTAPASSLAALGPVRLRFEFTNAVTHATPLSKDVVVDGAGMASLMLTPTELPLGAYTVRPQLVDPTNFTLSPPSLPTAVVINSDTLGATVYTLSDLLNAVMP